MFCLFYIIPIISSLYSKNSNTSAKLLIKFGLCKKLAESLLRKDKLSKFVMILDVLYPTIETYEAFCLASIWMLDIIGNKKIITMTYGYIRVDGLSAEIERNLISQRTKEALARKKDDGVQLGRRPKERFSSQDSESEQGHRAALLPYFFRREKMKKCLLYCVFQNYLLSLQRILSTNSTQ